MLSGGLWHGLMLAGLLSAVVASNVTAMVEHEAVPVFPYQSASLWTATPIPDAVFQRMQGQSYKKGCPTPRADLRYLRLLHYDAEGIVHEGELVCHKSISADLLAIFKALYEARYPIARMTLVDDYDADDERSMVANNTSCFNYRRVAGRRSLSKHASGCAIDINPLYNPHVRASGVVTPVVAKAYANRAKAFPYKIVRGDLCYRLFRQHGFRWGGDWKSSKDYQHFEK